MNISDILINWYDNNKRDLPWRKTQNPYKIWISEVILQQTRVNQGLAYYLNFLEKFPNLESLALANIDDVLKQWQGLGYYSRARNLHETAKYIVKTLNGNFPEQYTGLLKLKGVGEYTAAAIASFCFNEPVAVLDGNVKRVVSRLYSINLEISSTKFTETSKSILKKLIDKKQPGDFNQAIMEFGAMQCVPVSPNCGICVLNHFCDAFKNNTVSSLPLKTKKTKTRKRYFYYIVASYKNQVAICKRQHDDIWKGLYEFPLLEFDKKQNVESIYNNKIWGKVINITSFQVQDVSKTYKHILSHQVILAKFIKIVLTEPKINFVKNVRWIAKKDVGDIAVSRLIDKYLHEFEL